MKEIAIRQSTLCPAALLLTVFWALPAGALQIDFEGLAHGAVVTGQFAGVAISTTNLGGGPSLGVIFDSERANTSDPDLERGGGGWAAGNLPSNTVLGNLLIIQENGVGCGTGVCSDPDDEGTRPAGSFTLTFDRPYRELAFDLIDVEDSTLEGGAVEFHLTGVGLVGSLGFAAFVEPGPFFDPSVRYGNNSANRIAPIPVADLGPATSFDRVVFRLGGSGAIDNVVVSAPEPGAILLFAIGFVAVATTRRASARG